MTKLVMRLLGGYRVELDGKAVYGFETDKARALLAYLMVEGDRPHRRETLASLLWPDRPDTSARTNLRQALASVRRALSDYEPPFFIFASSTDVQFNTASDYMLDVAELETAAHVPGHRPRLLPEAFCADFLAGFSMPDSEAFEAWVLNKQEYYHRLALEILGCQEASFEATGDYVQAVAAARLQLRMEPWLEEAHRACMRALALAGRRDEALHQYEVCRRALDTELGVEPASSTQALYADIRDGRLASASRPSHPVELGPGSGGVTPPLHFAPPIPLSLPPRAAPATPAHPPANLVARQDQLGQLGRHLEAALAGETEVAFVSGDVGSGKTALLENFAAAAMAEHPDLLVAGARCSPGGSQDPFGPLRKLAEMLFGDLSSDAAWRLNAGDQVGRLQRASDLTQAALREHGLDLVDTLVPASSVARRASASAHGFAPLSESGRATPVKKRQRLLARSQVPGAPEALSQSALFDELICTLAAIARTQPLLLLLDDLHWVDDATVAFLLHLGRAVSDSRMLMVGAFRSATVALGRRDPHSGEFTRHPLAAAINEMRRAHGEVVVELDRVDGRAFVEAYVDTEPNRLGARFRDALYAQTGGHALFTVESLRNLQERGEVFRDEAGRWVAREPLDWGALPARVEAAIGERIERVPDTCRRILSAASVHGDDFSGEVVAELTGIAAIEVLTCLSGTLARQHHLVRPQGLQRSRTGQQSIYRFGHHLFQRYLYDQLDPVERARWHAAVAASLDRQVGDDPVERERLSAQLAWHYEAGGLYLAAARALYDAGRQAMRVSAFREALTRFDHALALVAREPRSAARTELERSLELARLGPERNLEGMGASEFAVTLARAAEVWAGAPTGEAQGRSKLVMLSADADRLFGRGQFEDGLAVAERLREQATESGEESFVALAHWHAATMLSTTMYLQEAKRHFDWVLDWLTPQRWEEVRAAIGFDLASAVLAYSALYEWLLGYGETALARSIQATAGAFARGDTYGQTMASALGLSVLFLLRSDGPALEEQARECHQLSLRHGFGMWRAHAEVFLGRLMVRVGDHVSGIERMQNGIEGWQASGMVTGIPGLVVVLADSCLFAASQREPGDDERAGMLTTGLEAIDRLLDAVVKPGGQTYDAELHRLRGELLLARDGLAASAEAAGGFDHALRLGHEKGALAWEVRAAMSLVRLWQRLGDTYAAELHSALRRLREVYERFTEGFACPDLQDAAALLNENG